LCPVKVGHKYMYDSTPAGRKRKGGGKERKKKSTKKKKTLPCRQGDIHRRRKKDISALADNEGLRTPKIVGVWEEKKKKKGKKKEKGKDKCTFSPFPWPQNSACVGVPGQRWLGREKKKKKKKTSRSEPLEVNLFRGEKSEEGKKGRGGGGGKKRKPPCQR